MDFAIIYFRIRLIRGNAKLEGKMGNLESKCTRTRKKLFKVFCKSFYSRAIDRKMGDKVQVHASVSCAAQST